MVRASVFEKRILEMIPKIGRVGNQSFCRLESHSFS